MASVSKKKNFKMLELISSGTHNFRRCSRSPRGEGMDPLILLLEMSLNKVGQCREEAISDKNK